ncbi:MAG: hypothetical protein U0517_01635 [Candidatus Andersenbacteria bacterium]
MRILIGVILLVAGILLVIFSQKIYENFGPNRWAEEKLGGGGTVSLLRIVGAILILLGLFIWVGLFDLIFGGAIRVLFGGIKNSNALK